MLVSIAVAMMSAAMVANDDPGASTAQLVLFLVTGAAACGYGYAIGRPLFDPIEPGPRASAGDRATDDVV